MDVMLHWAPKTALLHPNIVDHAMILKILRIIVLMTNNLLILNGNG
jgi:hypothetical protein